MVRKIVGTFLYYALAVYSTMLIALSYLATTQANYKEQTYNDVLWFLNYAVSQQTAVVRYNQSNVVLWFHIDASYFSVQGGGGIII